MRLKISALLIILLLAGCVTTNKSLPFAGSTKCKPITRMTQQQWRQSILGNDLYTRVHGHQVKNTMKVQQIKKRR